MTSTADASSRTRSPWVLMGLVLSGTFLLGLDRTIVNVTLPDIGLEFADSGGLDIVVAGYFVAVGVAQPGTGWLADRFGKKRVYLAALALFTLASLLAGVAPSLDVLVVARILQGVFGGAMMPLSLAMVFELFPPERRGRAFAVWGICSMISPALGPIVGGGLATSSSWRWAFLLNVPIGLLVLPVAARFLPADDGHTEDRVMDGLGWAFAGAGLPMLLFGVSRGSEAGWSDTGTLLLVLGGCALVALFVLRSLRVSHPLLDLSMVRIPAFGRTMLVQWLVSVPYTAQLVLVPLLLVAFRGMTPLDAGLIVTPSALGSMVTMRLAGRQVDRVGVRRPTVVGTALLAVASALLAAVGTTAPVPVLVAVMVVQGMGGGMALMPLTVAALDAVPAPLVAQGSALRALNKMTAQGVGVSVMMALLAAQLGGAQVVEATLADVDAARGAYVLVFGVMAAMLVAALPVVVRLPGVTHAQVASAPVAANLGDPG